MASIALLFVQHLSQRTANAAQDPNCVLAASEAQQDDSLLVCLCLLFCIQSPIV